jgi:hypothetical protein
VFFNQNRQYLKNYLAKIFLKHFLTAGIKPLSGGIADSSADQRRKDPDGVSGQQVGRRALREPS